jgi:two-component system chemotaxis sensor kinase CheA
LTAAAGKPPVDVALSEDCWDELTIDDETLEIFQDEASGLLANIRTNIQTLSYSPADTNALWEIRRNAHTFKGAAGIVGMKRASALAHHVEDLLDKMVESRRPADLGIVELLSGATDALESLTTDSDDLGLATALTADLEKALESLSSTADRSVSSSAPHDNAQVCPAQPIPAASTPIVRVSLDRLDELIGLARLLTQEGAEFVGGLTTEMLRRLQQLRMVRFGTVETRLARAVHVTCQEENKRAELSLDGADVEVDTQIIDALVEPLVHVLKNAVVHGIESAEVRRLLANRRRVGSDSALRLTSRK